MIVQQHVAFQDLSAGHTVVPVHQASRAIVEDIVADSVLAGDRLEVGCCLLDPDPNGIDMVGLRNATVCQQLSSSDRQGDGST